LYQSHEYIDEMDYQDIEFLGSFTELSQCPKPDKPEYAFIGRSNVGKSSLINALTGRKALARVSKAPGKTQTINIYEIDEVWRLVDLPGYGYAKVSQKLRKQWDQMIINYLSYRRNLVTAFVLVDGRIPPQKIDLEFINRLGKKQIPFSLLFTKWDKVKPKAREKTEKEFAKTLEKDWEELPKIIPTSSAKKEGIKEIQSFIARLNESLL